MDNIYGLFARPWRTIVIYALIVRWWRHRQTAKLRPMKLLAEVIRGKTPFSR